MSRVLLLDADILAYKACSVNQKTFSFGTAINEADTYRAADDMVREYAEEVGGVNDVIVCLTDSDGNFRKAFDTRYYKTQRATQAKPQLLEHCKAYLAEGYTSYWRPRLEADDIMAILACHPDLVPGEKIIVSEDKDLRTVPGKLWNPDRRELGVIDITPLEAAQFHMWQTIVGDTADNVKGAPGVGKNSVYAQDVLELDTAADLWDCVLEAFASRGGTEDDAIHQARMLRMLRHYDYNFRTKKVRLWNPTRLWAEV